jgi:hypothetical protein
MRETAVHRHERWAKALLCTERLVRCPLRTPYFLPRFPQSGFLARTCTVLTKRPHGRTHPRESVTKAGIQGQTLRRPSLGPRFRVVFRVISKGLRRGLIGQASQSGAVIVINEAQDEGIALLMGIELASGVDIFPGAQRLGEASVEALNHAIGLRSERFGQPMFGVERVAGLVKRGGVRTVDLRACSSCRRRSGR